MATTPPGATFDVKVACDGGEVLIAVEGEIDMCTAPVLESAFSQALTEGHRIVVDFTEVSFLDSQGVRVLLNAHQQHPDVRLRGLRPSVRQVLVITGLEHIFHLDD
jgi:anti-anti-sigma factor